MRDRLARGWGALLLCALLVANAGIALAANRKSIRFPSFPEYEAKLRSWEQNAEPVVRALIVRLDGGTPLVRATAALEINGEGFRGAIPALVMALEDGTGLEWRTYPGSPVLHLVDPREPTLILLDDGVQLPIAQPSERHGTSPSLEATEALIRIGAPAEEFFQFCLNDPKSRYRALGAFMLRHFPTPATTDVLIRFIEDRNQQVRGHAVEALGLFKAAGAVDPLLAVLARGEASEKVVEALGLIGDASAVQPLLASLERGAGGPRAHVARALGRLRDPHAVDALLRMLTNDGFLPARAEAAGALGEIGDRRAIPTLVQELENNQPNWMERHRPQDAGPWPAEIRMNIASALKKLTGEDLGENADRWKAWLAEEQRAGRKFEGIVTASAADNP